MRPRVWMLAPLLVVGQARADGRERDIRQAQSLFERARLLMEDGDLAHACPLFAESQRLDPGGGTLLNLALCHERQGRTATAWAEYNDALALAVRDGREDRREFAHEHIEALRDRLPRVRVVIDQPTAGLVVALDDTTLSALSLGADLPVDPGAHVVTASAAEHAPWRSSFVLADGQQLDVHVPALARETRAHETRLATASWVLGGIAVGALATSAITGILALSANGAASDKCVADRDYCPDPTYADDVSRARTLAWISTGALAIGAGAGLAAVLWPRQPVGVSVQPGQAQLTARWSF